MLHDWVSETTVTVGTGTITLAGAASADLLAITDSDIPDGALVEYQIKSGNNREKGLGIYTAPATLARTEVLATWVSGVYDNTLPSAISLTGTSDVFIAGTASSHIPSNASYMPFNVGAGELFPAGYQGVATIGTRSWGASRAFIQEAFVPGWIYGCTGMGIEIDTIASTGSEAVIGLYRLDRAANTYRKIDDCSTITVNSTPGPKSSTWTGGTKDIPPGMYFIIVGSDSDVLFKGWSNYHPQYFPAKDRTTELRALFITGGYSSGLAETYTANHDNRDTTSPAAYFVTV